MTTSAAIGSVLATASVLAVLSYSQYPEIKSLEQQIMSANSALAVVVDSISKYLLEMGTITNVTERRNRNQTQVDQLQEFERLNISILKLYKQQQLDLNKIRSTDSKTRKVATV